MEDRKTSAPEGAVVVAVLDPLQVAVHLMMQTDAKRFFLGCLATESTDLETRRLREKIRASYDWPYAMKCYQQWVNCYGEQAVLAASDKVRNAAKRLFVGYVADPQAIGSIRGKPSSAIQELLVSNDTKGYVRAILSYQLKHPAADVLDSTYKDLISLYQEGARAGCGQTGS